MQDKFNNYKNINLTFIPLILVISIFIQQLDSTILNTSIPSIAINLKESTFNSQLIIVSYNLTLAIFIPISVFITNKFGTKNIFLFAISFFGIASVLCALSNNLYQLVLSRILQGIGGSFLIPISRLTIIRSFPKKDLLKTLNFAVIPSLIAPVLGPTIGGYIVGIASWRWVFLINVPFTIIGIIFGILFLPNYKENKLNKFDKLGLFIFALSTFIFTSSINCFDNEKINPLLSLTFLILGIVGFLIYIYYAKNTKNAIFPLSLFMVRTFRIGILSNFFIRLSIGALPLLIPLLLQLNFNYKPMTSGLMLIPLAIGMIMAKFQLYFLIKRFKYKSLLIINTIFTSVLLVLISQINQFSPLFYIIMLLFFIGIVNSMQFTMMNTITMLNLREYQYNNGTGLMTINQNISIAISVSIGNLLLRIFNKHNPIGQAFEKTFIILALISLLSVIIFSQMHKTDGKIK